MQLTIERFPVSMKRQQLATLDAQIDSFVREQNRWVELMMQHNLEGICDKRKWDTIEGNFKFEQQRTKEAQDERIKVAAGLMAQQLMLARNSLDELARLNGVITPALVAIRKELEIPTDDAVFAEIFHEAVERQKSAFGSFFDAARPWVPEDTDQPT
jgi:hypothetical protein